MDVLALAAGGSSLAAGVGPGWVMVTLRGSAVWSLPEPVCV